MRPARSALILAPAAALLVHALPAVAVTGPGSRLFPTVRRVPVEHAVGLTFDDGPDDCLNAFLDELARAGAGATFFVTGEQVARAPGRVAEIVAAGHEVGVHGFRHRHHLRLAPWQVAEDLRRARDTIEQATGQPVRLFRPPYGVFSLGSWRAADRHGWQRVLWSRAGRDWVAGATARSIADRISDPEPGEILLLHDSDRYSVPGAWRETLAALPLIFARLASAGLVARPVGELLDHAQGCHARLAPGRAPCSGERRWS